MFVITHKKLETRRFILFELSTIRLSCSPGSTFGTVYGVRLQLRTGEAEACRGEATPIIDY